MSESQTESNQEKPYFPDIQEVSTETPIEWLKKGWSDIKACPTASMFYGVSFVVGGYIMIFALADAPEYIAAAITGFVIMGPFLALGLYELSAQHERGEPCRLLPTLAACRKNVGNMAVFAIILLLVYLAWAQTSVMVFSLFYSGELPTMAEFFKFLILTEKLDFLITYFAIGAVFVLIIFAVSLITIPLIKDKQMDAISATIASTRALLMNPVPMIVWSGIIAMLSLFGVVTLLLGTMLVGPLLGHATWHAYRDLTGTRVDAS